MKKITSLMTICALSALSLVMGSVSAHGMHSYSSMKNMGVNFGYLVPEKQETFNFPTQFMSMSYGECHAMNLASGRVILVIPYDRTLILTPQNPSGTFNMPKGGFFYSKLTLKGSATPFSVLNPMNVVKMTTAPFTSGSAQQPSQVMLMCRGY
jgi:hypothetical protein